MDKRAAVARVWAYLNFKPVAKWLALMAGVVASVITILLLLVGGVFAEVLVSRGRAIEHSGLSAMILSLPERFLPWLSDTADVSHSAFVTLAKLAMIALVLAVIWAGLLLLMHRQAAIAAGEATLRMRRAVFHHSYRLGMLMVRGQGPAEAVSLVTGHIEAIYEALYAWLTVAIAAPVQFAFLLIIACLMHFWLTVVVVAGTISAWLIAAQLFRYFRRAEIRTLQQEANYLALVQENLMFLRLIKSCIMELFNQGRIDLELSEYARAQRRRAIGTAVLGALLVFLGTLAGVAFTFLTGITILDGRLAIADAILFTAVLASIVWPIRAWLNYRTIVRRGEQSALTLAKFLDRPRDVVQEAGATVLPALARRLEFDNVSLREVGSNRLLLQGINLTVTANQRLGLCGPDEAGKHALVYLLPRLVDPTSGEIRIDDHNLRSVTLESLRKQIGLVLQNNLVFSHTVSTNISCGNAAIKLPQIIEAAKLAHAHQFIQKLPKGYDTPIGDMGHPLNVGEKFRIALARVILREPALFIIEEPPAYYLDEDTCDLLDDTFARVLTGRTVIFLPHRMTTIQSCDEILLIHKGRIEARGTHDSLTQRSPLYRHLYYLEFNDFAGQLGG
jgi:ATP-binding cassette subfamily B protein